MNAEWQIPMSITSPQGTLNLNGDDGAAVGHRFLVDGQKSFFGPATVRTTTDDVPQANGGIVHRAFKSLTLAKFGLELWQGPSSQDANPACAGDLRAMWDKLMLHVEALVAPSQTALDTGKCRITWQPTDAASYRILDRVQVLQWPQPTFDGIVTAAEVTFQSPYPYAIDLTQTTTTVGATTTVTNTGTAPYWPVIKVFGPATIFQLSNTWPDGTFFFFQYDGTRPGAHSIAGGHYAEIDMFRNTIYLDGNSANLKAGINIEASDFFALAVGANIVSHTGDGTAQMLWQPAWS